MCKSSKDKNADRLDKIHDEALNAISAQDCTGLIPTAAQSEEEMESYEELYPFSADDELLL